MTPEIPRCAATLEHLHGVSRCERDAFHSEDPGDVTGEGYGCALEEHSGRCHACEEDDGHGTAPLRWTGFREVWP